MAFSSKSVQFVVMCILSPHDTQLYTASLLFMGFEHVLHLLLFYILELIWGCLNGFFGHMFCCDLLSGYQLVAVFR